MARLELNWSRYDVFLKRKAKTAAGYPSNGFSSSGGNHETGMAGATADSDPSGRAKTVGPCLSTADGVELGETSRQSTFSRNEPEDSGAE